MEFVSSTSGWYGSKWGDFILRTTNGGVTWERIQTQNIYGITDICMINPNKRWACGWDVYNHGVILTTDNGGLAWHIQKNVGECMPLSILFVDVRNG